MGDIPLNNAVSSDGTIDRDGRYVATYIVSINGKITRYGLDLPKEIVEYFQIKSGLSLPQLQKQMRTRLKLVLD